MPPAPGQIVVGIGFTLARDGRRVERQRHAGAAARSAICPCSACSPGRWPSGALIDALVALVFAGPPVIDARLGYWAGLLYLALAASVLTFSLYYPVVRKIGPAKAAYSSVLVPIIAMGFSTALEGYRWTPTDHRRRAPGARRNGRRAEPQPLGCAGARRRLKPAAMADIRTSTARRHSRSPALARPMSRSAARIIARPTGWCRRSALDFDLDPERTRVRATLSVERNGDHDRPLRLDGDELEAARRSRSTAQTADWRMDGPQLVIDIAGDRATVETEVEIDPAANTKLMGLYASGGMLCTQCEAEGFRRITFFPDRPDVLSQISRADGRRRRQLSRSCCRTATASRRARRRTAATGPSGRTRSPSPAICSRWSPATSQANRDSFTTMSGRKVDLAIWVREADLPKTAARDGQPEAGDGVGREGLRPRI